MLWGDAGQECTGIISTCYASPAVIKKAMELGCNFIVVHEALFWNHGDRTDWLEKNTAFRKKKALLEESGVCIWRYHDYVHAGIRVDGALHDGIFYGLSSLLGWNEYQTDKNALLCHDFCLPRAWTVQEMASFLTKKFHLEGVRFIGNPAAKIRKVQVPMHILGHLSDDRIIEQINEEDINCLLTLEMVDFTVCEYIRDAAMLGEDRCIFAVGHFNIEEIGMEYLADWLQQLAPHLPVHFMQSGDAYRYLPCI